MKNAADSVPGDVDPASAGSAVTRFAPVEARAATPEAEPQDLARGDASPASSEQPSVRPCAPSPDMQRSGRQEGAPAAPRPADSVGGSPDKAPPPVFEVAEDVRHLSPAELERLTVAFRDWYETAAGPVQRRARGRLWLAFLLFRYGALRLGEALGLDDVADVDRSRSLVRVGGAQPREVALPESVMTEVLRVLDDPMMFALRGQVLRLDPGYLRRRFYDRAGGCGLPRDHLSPRVLRHSRAIELLRGGVPLKVVQQVLGHQSVSIAGNLLRFSEDDARRILRRYLRKESQPRTSARNAFTGRVTSVRRSGFLVEVVTTTPTGLRVVSIITEESSTNLDIAPGAVVTATVKAPWVMLAPGGVTSAARTVPCAGEDVPHQGATSHGGAAAMRPQRAGEPGGGAAGPDHGDGTGHAPDHAGVRNRFAGIVSRLTDGGVAAEVIVDLPEGTSMCALVTSACVRELDLAVGRPVTVLFKAFSVILNVA